MSSLELCGCLPMPEDKTLNNNVWKSGKELKSEALKTHRTLSAVSVLKFYGRHSCHLGNLTILSVVKDFKTFTYISLISNNDTGCSGK